MKTLVKTLVLFITASLFSQNSIEKTVGEFKELKVYDLINVELIPAKEDKVEISGDNKDDVIIVNKNGTLKIKMSLGESFDGNKTKVKLFYTKIDIIDVNEGAKVTAKDPIKQFEIDLKAQEGGIINVPVDVSFTNVKAVTGGIVQASGTSKTQNISLYTGGEYQGKDLETERTDVSIKAAGDAYVKASNLVDAKVRAGGTVHVYGNPKEVVESTTFGGSIKRIN
ncbi:head GIN domain-containing protein [Neotamlana laminarinivorans]|uniref:DUF2807 domain-containing protein n=1 Tax=Neotamlana laminarinivorans TaxID=2883124 RepID=A0A9X1HYT8_9FLAO|nr:head GIN domain-containing protein [Tamlana laminarinivorans]MCB4798271.1 DUF2807 domain-containing protein [Tamlana laminarinivorans]